MVLGDVNMRALKQVAVWKNVTPELFQQEIAPLNEPAVLKNLVGDWPIVKASAEHQSLQQWLEQHYIGGDVPMAKFKHANENHFFYDKAFTGFNFDRQVVSFKHFIEQLNAFSSANNKPCVAIQSAPISDYFPRFNTEHKMSLFGEQAISARFWLGNQSTVVAHYDDAENIACVVAGKRRVTLFPPEQVANLYVGPLEFTPAGAPLSMANIKSPDFEKFPKLKTALNFALQAELSPGDAIYIPTLWWHHIEALSDINMLVNYWAGGSIVSQAKPVPMDAMLLAILTIRELPIAQRKAWQSFFDYYVFAHDEADHQHIPEQIRGILSPLTEQQKVSIKNWLKGQLS